MSLRALFEQHGLMEHFPAFERERVAVRDLPELTEQELSESFGVVSFGDRKRFRALVASLSSASSSTPTPTPTPAPPPAGATRVDAPFSAASASPSAGATRVDAAGSLPARIGSYRILGLVGSGGMGTVVRARHAEDGWAAQQGGDVAIKLIHPETASSAEFRSRFMAEAGLGRRLQHPGLVPVYDVVSDGPWLGTVMGLVLGAPLSQRIVPGGLSVSAVASLLEPVGAALDHLHSHGVVHRDVKPANIMVRSDGSAVLLDLGIAKDTRSDLGPHTRTMTSLGTSAWMAPEQADAKRVDGAADRYAFGLLAYALLAGRMPWGSDATEARVLATKLMGQLEPLSVTKPGVAGSVSTAVMSMLSLSPNDRPSSCGAFMAQLRAAEADWKRAREAAAQAEQLRKRQAEAEAARADKAAAERKAREAAERQAKAEAEQRERIAAAEKAKAERQAREAAERRARAESAQPRPEAQAPPRKPDGRAGTAGHVWVHMIEGGVPVERDQLSVVSTVLATPNESHLVWRTGMPGWVSWQAVPELAAAVGAARQAATRKAGDRRAVIGLGLSSFTFDVAYIPPGEFEMGSPTDEVGRDSDEVQHRVRLTRALELSVFPVTQALYTSVMGVNPSHYKRAQLPVETVSWIDAVTLCNAVSRACGLPEAYTLSSGADPVVTWNQTTGGFRLPTESEWEYAARAGTRQLYAGGDDLDLVGWFKGNSGSRTHPPGLKRPNAWGVYDMSGNVWEWCWDWRAAYPTRTAVDPTGPAAGSARVLRGGSCYFVPRYSRVAVREAEAPGFLSGVVGIRLVRTVT